MKKAIALISGGLDSILAARLIKEQGIEIIPLHFKIPFSQREKKNKDRGRWVADNLGVELKSIDISKDFLPLLTQPKHGFGANLNPCIDCKILMLKRSKEMMPGLGAAFVVSGEVLGQRPMSQYRRALEMIEKESGLEGLVLRPLSAKLLQETIPEKEGWVSKDKLLDFSGRTRKPQIELAKRLDIKDYPCPAGGCLLTDPEFSKRLKELIKHRELNLDNVELLKIGRHFRLGPETKLVVGRNEEENEELANLAKENDYLFSPDEKIAGPTSLGRGKFDEDLIKLASSIASRYCDLNGHRDTEIIYRRLPLAEEKRVRISTILENELNTLRL